MHVEAEGGDLACRELKIDHLVLRPENVDLADSGHGQHLGADVLDLIAELPLAQPIAREGINVPEHVAEAIVEAWADHPLREIALDVGNHVADPHPGRLHVDRLGGVAQIDEHGGLARDGDALRVVERLQFFELLLDPVSDLARHLLGRGAWPLRLDHHGLDGEVRVLLTSELKIGKQAGHHEGDHEIPDERAVPERPVGKIERLHGS